MRPGRPYYHYRFPAELFQPAQRRLFFGLFRRRKAKQLRPGAMSPKALRKQIEEIGVGQVVEVIRIGYDGRVDDIPMSVEIRYIDQHGFHAKVVNVERKIIEENSTTMVYAKRGGGMMEFGYNDGDIKEINVNSDETELSAARDVGAMMEILEALEVHDRILVAYYDGKHHGTVNVEGELHKKSSDNSNFQMLIDKINGIELDNKVDKTFEVERDIVIDIAIV